MQTRSPQMLSGPAAIAASIVRRSAGFTHSIHHVAPAAATAPIRARSACQSPLRARPPTAMSKYPAPSGRNIFLYVVRGKLDISGTPAQEHHLIELNDDGDVVDIEAAMDSLILFGHALPIAEPVVSYGPFVMNTKQEIAEAISDYQAGKFGSSLDDAGVR